MPKYTVVVNYKMGCPTTHRNTTADSPAQAIEIVMMMLRRASDNLFKLIDKVEVEEEFRLTWQGIEKLLRAETTQEATFRFEGRDFIFIGIERESGNGNCFNVKAYYADTNKYAELFMRME
jgi:hypothetical protein